MRRAALFLAALAALAPGAAAGHVLVSEQRVLECLLLVQFGSVGAAVNCSPVDRQEPATAPDGGLYKLTVTWTPRSADWGQLRADLESCREECRTAGSGVCLNNNCVGNPRPANVVQQASAIDASPLVVTIPTDGDETLVRLVVRHPGGVAALLPSQGIRYVLEHVG